MNGKAKGLSDRKTTPGQGTRPTMRGQAKDLSDRNTCFICDEGERESGLEGNLRLNSLMFAYVRLIGEKCLRPPALELQRFQLWIGKPAKAQAASIHSTTSVDCR